MGCRSLNGLELVTRRMNVYLIVTALLLLISDIANSNFATLPETEYLALYDLYNSTKGAEWTWSDNPILGIPWSFTSDANPCADGWQGVTCIVVNDPPLHTDHVYSLFLVGMNLSGYLPESIGNLTNLQSLYLLNNQLTGTIPSSIGRLSYMQMLHLEYNRLTGDIPSSLGDLTALENMCLFNNQLTGMIPATVGNLSNLIILDLEYNSLTGPIPSSIGNLNQLEKLYLCSNHLTGGIPQTFGFLTRLVFLEICLNRLTGTIPNFVGNLTHLRDLIVYSNQLEGTIPSSFNNLKELQYLFLHLNELTGTLPDTLGSIPSLLQLDLNINFLTGSIPSSLSNLVQLTSLSLGSNNLNGSIPGTIGNLISVKSFYLYQNALTGTIPSSIGNMTLLKAFYLENNRLTGSIPSSIGEIRDLLYINFGTNRLTGTIPSSIGALPILQQLYLNHNQFNGTIPSSLCNLKLLQQLDLNNNELTGRIPHAIGNLALLGSLYIGDNRLTGTIPDSIGNVTSLQVLDLSYQRLTGTVPESVAQLRRLSTLFLQGNQLTGPLEGRFSVQQLFLVSIQINGNQFTGTLPAVLFDLPSLVSFSMVGSCLHGTLPGNICNATQLEALILYGLTTGASCRARGASQSNKAFHGAFPSCLLQLPRMTTLLLSSNGLTGSIASDTTLGPKLIQLDLSHNDLSGSIPNSLQNYSWTLFDLSHNKLSGVLHSDLLKGISYTTPFIAPTVSLTSNRLSGNVPSSLRPLQSDLSVLAGNLFECKYDKSNLPQHDSDISNYQCASNDFNIAIYAWLGIALCVSVYIAQRFSNLHTSVQIVVPAELTGRLTHVFALVREFHVWQKIGWLCAAFCMCVLLPYYAIVSHYEGTHTYQYAYVLSAIYTRGVLPFAFNTLLLGLLPFSIFCSMRVKNTIAACSIVPHRGLVFVWLSFIVINVTVVLGANVAFVYVVLYQSSQVQTLVQILLSLFKLSWSMIASPYMIRQLNAYFLPQTEKHPEPLFTLQLLVALFNNIAIPCLVVAAIDPNCFSNILLPPDSQTVAYLLPTCFTLVGAQNSACKTTSYEIVTLTFTPPFTYSYQCSASFITSYAPTFIYMSISTVFLNPLLQYVLLRLHERLPAGSIAHHIVTWYLPRILEPLNADPTRYIRRSFVRPAGTLVTLLTQLGILLTFGAIFPPVALGMAVSITAVVVMTRYKVQRFVRAVLERQLFAYLDIINAECEKVGTREQMQVAVVILICYCCAFYTLFLFDTLGDAVGFEASVWVLVVFPLLPFAVYGATELFGRLLQGKVRNQERDCEAVAESASGGAVELKDIFVHPVQYINQGFCASGDKTGTVSALHSANV